MHESTYFILRHIQHYRSMLAVKGVGALSGTTRESVEKLLAEAEEVLLAGEKERGGDD